MDGRWTNATQIQIQIHTQIHTHSPKYTHGHKYTYTEITAIVMRIDQETPPIVTGPKALNRLHGREERERERRKTEWERDSFLYNN